LVSVVNIASAAGESKAAPAPWAARAATSAPTDQAKAAADGCHREQAKSDQENAAMTENISHSAATDEQSAEHQRVRGEGPLLASFAESQCWANRRQRRSDDRHVKHNHELRDADDSDGRQSGPAAVTSKMTHAGNIPSCSSDMYW
jgi:hypothetical protein